jgi:large subunit ribosomal protein L10
VCLLPTEQKRETVAALKTAIAESQGLYVTEFSRLSANAMNDLRAQVEQAGGRFVVVKNRLMKLAAADTGAAGLSDVMIGPRALVFCYEDPIAPAKAISKFGEDHANAVTLKAAYVDGKVFDEAQAKMMADIPSREELLAAVVSAIAAPVTGLVHALGGPTSDLVFTVQAVADKRGDSAA